MIAEAALKNLLDFVHWVHDLGSSIQLLCNDVFSFFMVQSKKTVATS